MIGQEVPLPVLEAVADFSARASPASGLVSCKSQKCFTRRACYPDVAYTFKHALTHEMAYSSLLRETRRTLHRRVGEAIEAIYPDRLAELAETLTDHFERGEVWAQAARYALDAAEKAKSRYAYPVGMQYARRALSAAAKDAGLGQEWIWASVLLGDLASLVNDLDLANESYDQALAKSPKTPPNDAGSRTSATSCNTPSATARRSRTISTGAATRRCSSSVRSAMAWLPGSRFSSACARNFASSPSICAVPGAHRPSSRPYTDRDHALDIATVVRAVSDRPIIGVGLSAAPYALVRAAVTDPAAVQEACPGGRRARRRLNSGWRVLCRWAGDQGGRC